MTNKKKTGLRFEKEEKAGKQRATRELFVHLVYM